MLRKIIRIGNSDGITIPVSVLRSYKLKAGDKVEVHIGKPGSRIKYFELLEELDKFNKEYKKARKN